ncbi:thiamine kinase-like enzyme [Cytobacillus horneckiae]|uniref:Phosphotransferase n=1 Tax=Cytobacillus horneckiae TaxID=549687 RepID=A0A2N0ZAD6_9BACI|nr:phosphotransferase family protein [Cytobacillus horneckiae]NRG44913.1 phosphotransferase family protein [Bacillus sp. CRN 9]MBN6889391.1 phosphotransferase family protein [Cytobacillus horneckiae]MCM3179522.1 phosphotransferase family protein [Cytobacillus horneckiae]MEC1154946.1 phosphotransferase family protein [Cytobacillus horneckiae]MED2936148.1 phosphotransferase family protein [Cytobacillus horneckiae]
MENLFGDDWEIVPAGGATGEAYYAQHEEQRLFLKRNSSPFLAVLSAEGIVPKLVWTKRMENGDVFTAQQWMNGSELKASEMNNERVARLLKKIHSSKPLLGMLTRLGKSAINPETVLKALLKGIDRDLKDQEDIHKSIHFLKEKVDFLSCEEKTVCHCDVNHNNWLLTEDNQLYLIDWDGAVIGDPAIDLGTLLYSYIPVDEWADWVKRYGLELTDDLRLRMKWYVIAQTLDSIQWHKSKFRFQEMNHLIQGLGRMLTLDYNN